MNKIIHGDCLEVMREMEENSIDTVITDPPYGLSFMGKRWDYDVPSIEIWKECLRVLKPGGTALIFAGSRTQHRMAVNVEDAGFILKDCIMWLYGSGFPKATDISKQLDKVIGKQGRGFKAAGDDGRKAEFKQDKSFRSDYGYKWKPSGEEAKLWNGWKSHGLKPAYEPILVCQKPNEGTYANNALKWGVSGLNIDGGRIGTETMINHGGGKNEEGRKYGGGRGIPTIEKGTTEHQGRFPANIILDEEAGKMLDEQSGESKSSSAKRNNKASKNIAMSGDNLGHVSYGHTDKGGASRFFYCAKASKRERGEENNHPTVKPLSLMEYLCTLTKTPTGGIVLDPFCGSGTTLLAAKNTDREYIGIEKELEYIKIAEARLKDKQLKLI